MSNQQSIEIKPQKGPQEDFLSSSADFVVYGGAAGGGKTFALLLENLRHMNNAGFRSVIFRQSYPQIHNPGGLWDESLKLYLNIPNATPKQTDSTWAFTSGCQVMFSYLGETSYQQNLNKEKWQGSQFTLVCFDELTHFDRSAVFYMLSRNRSVCGVKPYVRATCNPDNGSWVREFIDWWIDEDGIPIPDRCGVIRYFIILNDEVLWGETKEGLEEKHEDCMPLSFTFIAAKLSDNKILVDADPGYLAKLKALPLLERERLLGGNWNIRANNGLIFKREWFEIVNAMPSDSVRIVRRWDLAATKGGGDWTVGLKMARVGDKFFVLDIVRMQGSSHEVEQAILNTASQDGQGVEIGLPQDPGQAGKAQSEYLTGRLSGYIVSSVRETGDKVTRAMPASSQSEVGNIKILKAPWNNIFLSELDNFTGEAKNTDDQVDSFSGAFKMLAEAQAYAWIA